MAFSQIYCQSSRKKFLAFFRSYLGLQRNYKVKLSWAHHFLCRKRTSFLLFFLEVHSLFQYLTIFHFLVTFIYILLYFLLGMIFLTKYSPKFKIFNVQLPATAGIGIPKMLFSYICGIYRFQVLKDHTCRVLVGDFQGR